jgi:hypothetical protein
VYYQFLNFQCLMFHSFQFPDKYYQLLILFLFYDLNLDCLPMINVLKVLLWASSAIGRKWNLLDVRPSSRKLGQWRNAPEGDSGIPASPFALTFASQQPGDEQPLLPCALIMMYCLVTGPSNYGPNQPWIKSLKLWAK